MVTAVSELFGIDPARFLKMMFEVSLISMFAVCFAHSCWVHGWKRTLREFSAGFILTAVVENLGVLCGAYIYPGFNCYVYATPLLNPLSWVALVYMVIEFTNRIVYGPRSLKTYEKDGYPPKAGDFAIFKGSIIKTILLLAAIDATFCVLIDLIEDPLATIYNWWLWVPYEKGVVSIGPGMIDAYNFNNHVFMTTPDNAVLRFFAGFFPDGLRYPTRVFGIPLINFIDWILLVFMFSFSFRWVESKDGWGEIKKTLVLYLLMIVIMILLPMTILINI
jgi:uncharacterized membrane protein